MVDNKVTTVKEKATETLANASSTKEEALALEEEIKDALNKTQGKEGAPDTVLCQISNSGLFPNWLRTKYTYLSAISRSLLHLVYIPGDNK